jgi:peptidoglycan/xylan/chitin deacetylase (PgdA/CDA1 family)
MNRNEKVIYMTFDDGPHPEITPFALETLALYEVKATFFCIGNNVKRYPEVYKKLINAGHKTGNHTHTHMNGWKVSTPAYMENTVFCSGAMESTLFRPPYGKIKPSQAKALQKEFNIVMWSLLSGDFDREISPEKCLENVIKNARSGDIIVFHDSEKAFKNLRYALPRSLEALSEKGYSFSPIILP